MKFSKGFALLVFIFSAGFVRSQDYVWPTDASHLITSTFGEYRPDHIHPGIDIKTWGQEGYRVIAIDDGSIIRVRVSPYGYGRVVFHQLDNGMVAVYAHLSRFDDRVEQIVKKEQKRIGRFAIQKNFPPGNLIVKKGDLIGYTGSSGADAAHLHFEIRNQEGHPLNPFHVGYQIQDTIPPQCQSLAVTPLRYGSHVNGDFLPQIYPLKSLTNGVFMLEDEITAWGNIGLALSAYDQANGASNRFQIYRVQLFVDEQPIYSVQYDCFPLSLTQQIDLDRDYRLRRWGDGLFQKLYVDIGNQLPFYKPQKERAGVLSCWGNKGKISRFSKQKSDLPTNSTVPTTLEPGEHTLRIIAEDYFGNQSTIQGTLRMIPVSELMPDMNLPESGPTSRIPEGTKTSKMLIEKRFLQDYLRFRILSEDPLAAMPDFFIKMNGKVNHLVSLIPISFGEFIGSIPLDRDQNGEMIIEFQYITQPGWIQSTVDTLEIFSIIPGKHNEMVSPDGICKITFPVESVYQPYWGTIQSSPVPPSLSSIQKIYRIVPDDVPLQNKIGIRITIPSDLPFRDKMAVYGFGEKGTNVYLGGHWETSETLSTETGSLTSVVVQIDTVSPVIYQITPASGSHIQSATPTITVQFEDLLSGIYGEDNYVVRLDRKRCIMEYQPGKKSAFYQVENPIGKGRHVIDVMIRDRSGNVAEAQSVFHVHVLK